MVATFSENVCSGHLLVASYSGPNFLCLVLELKKV